MSISGLGNKNALGHKLSDESRRKCGSANIANKYNFGKKNRLGQKNSPEHQAKINAARAANPNLKGWKHTDEAKAKIRIANLQRKSSKP